MCGEEWSHTQPRSCVSTVSPGSVLGEGRGGWDPGVSWLPSRGTIDGMERAVTIRQVIVVAAGLEVWRQKSENKKVHLKTHGLHTYKDKCMYKHWDSKVQITDETI